MFKRKYLFAILYSIFLVMMFTYNLLDTFVLENRYEVVKDSGETKQNSNSSEDAKNSYGKNIKERTSDIATSNNAILAINGDYYGFRSSGYVIRNSTLYRDTKSGDNNQDLVIYSDGSFEIVDESDIDANELMNKSATQVLSFGPGLIEDRQITVDENTEVSMSKSSNPRTAIGCIDKNHYVLVVSDGRTSESEGLSLYQLATLMKDYGCEIAYNLDGGGSSTMWFNGQVINKPTSGRSIEEREVSDIVYIGY